MNKTTKKLLTQTKNSSRNSIAIASLATLMVAAFSLAVPAYADDIDLTGGFPEVIHSGDDLDKTVAVTASFDQGDGLVDTFPMTVTHSNNCGTDAIGNDVITVTPVSQVLDDFADTETFNEKVTAMPGEYQCVVTFTVTDDDGDFGTVDQENGLLVIGSHGYWKNHPTATTAVCDDAEATSITIGLKTFLDADCGDLQDVLEEKGGNIVDRYARESAAAQLNAIATGTTPCTEVTDALAAGDAILIAEGYNGVPGTVTNGAISKVDREALNDAKDILDAYNNDSFCVI